MGLLQMGFRVHGIYKLIAILFFFLFLSVDPTFGSSDLMIGVQGPLDPQITGVVASYDITNNIDAPSDVTIFASGALIDRGNIMFVVSGEKGIEPLVDGMPSDFKQSNKTNIFNEDFDVPYYIWDLGRLSNPESKWTYSYMYNNVDYYKKSVHISESVRSSNAWAYIDNDNDHYFSETDDISGIIDDGLAKDDAGNYIYNKMYINDDGMVVFAKGYDGQYNQNEIITCYNAYLEVNNIRIDPIVDDFNDLIIKLCDGTQTWELLKEYSLWRDINHFGYYTDLGVGDNIFWIFEGPDNEGYEITTNLPGDSVGLWLLNDINGNYIYDGNDSYLFSERSLTKGSGANEHQWFLVYDVRPYKGMGATYDFITSTEDFTTIGDYDYLIYIDDNHTSANWDHNDMILAITCNNAPEATCPPDTGVFLCELGSVCIPGFECYDVDDNLASCDVDNGTLTDGSVTFTPVAGANVITLTATDECGETDVCQTVVTVTLNSPPEATCPWGAKCDTTIFLCELTEICGCLPDCCYSNIEQPA